jgi:solute carrier family 35 protein F5
MLSLHNRDNYTFNLSLTMTSVSSNTILSATSSLFTLILSSIFGVERFNIVKLLGVLITLGGVVAVALADTRNSGTDTVWGDGLALFSAFTYGLYVTFFKRQVKNEDRVPNSIFLGELQMEEKVLTLMQDSWDSSIS